jgi:hypothetical protein
MPDQLTDCPRCGSDACYHISEEDKVLLKPVNIYLCYGCGFQTNDALFNSIVDASFVESLEKTMPELYKELKWIDEHGNCWYPQTVNNVKQGMIFAEGVDKDNWKWSAVIAKPIDFKDKKKFKPGTTHVMDMSTKKEFGQNDFIEALDYIGYFNQTFI